ncbi:MAG: metallophosphoesterase family protein [Candidatus Thorarchaeota archaeon]
MIKTDKKELLIGLLSDTHVPSRTNQIPNILIEDFKKRGVDYVFHLGDFTSYEVYQQLLNTFGRIKVIAIIGNMDFEPKLKKSLPEKREFELFNHKILMVHGMGGPNMIVKRLIKHLNLIDKEYNIVLFGHTHRPMNEYHNGILFLNPGTCTPVDNKFTVISSYGFLKISKEKIEPEIIYLSYNNSNI